MIRSPTNRDARLVLIQNIRTARQNRPLDLGHPENQEQAKQANQQDLLYHTNHGSEINATHKHKIIHESDNKQQAFKKQIER